MTGQLSAAEERFERLRQKAGLFLGPAIALVLWSIPIAGLADPAQRLLGIVGLIVTLWVTEALPLPVTALLGPTLCVLAGIAPAREAFRSFGDPIIFLFLGSFLIAEGMLHHGLSRRIAFQILAWRRVGQHPAALLAAMAVITGFISMWVSNTATTAMMFPIGMALLSEMSRQRAKGSGNAVALASFPYGTGLMLVTAFAASIGGLATPVGTPPNLIGLGLLERHLNVRVTFFQWMCFGVPLAVILIGFLIVYLNRLCPAQSGLLNGGAEWIRAEKARLGPMHRGEANVLVAFSLTVVLWLLPGLGELTLGAEHPAAKWMNGKLPEAIVALLGGLMLFILPVNFARGEFTLGWNEAKRIDWGTILLFGGGLALGELMFSTGLAEWLGRGLAEGLAIDTPLALVAIFTATAIVLSETTSNTASATMVIPVAISVANAAKVDPLGPALGACLGASMGFMLPVSTPPNAIVYGSGYVPLLKMIKYGLLLDVVSFAVIVPAATWLIPWLIRS